MYLCKCWEQDPKTSPCRTGRRCHSECSEDSSLDKLSRAQKGQNDRFRTRSYPPTLTSCETCWDVICAKCWLPMVWPGPDNKVKSNDELTYEGNHFHHHPTRNHIRCTSSDAGFLSNTLKQTEVIWWQLEMASWRKICTNSRAMFLSKRTGDRTCNKTVDICRGRAKNSCRWLRLTIALTQFRIPGVTSNTLDTAIVWTQIAVWRASCKEHPGFNILLQQKKNSIGFHKFVWQP